MDPKKFAFAAMTCALSMAGLSQGQPTASPTSPLPCAATFEHSPSGCCRDDERLGQLAVGLGASIEDCHLICRQNQPCAAFEVSVQGTCVLFRTPRNGSVGADVGGAVCQSAQCFECGTAAPTPPVGSTEVARGRQCVSATGDRNPRGLPFLPHFALFYSLCVCEA
eukprot:m.62021 g.62021  ORF g.62021 m.62021 type:complete len:166 (-) comp9590_c0_seq3:2343-2840(-)